MTGRTIINVISTKRSGHHAFIYWLQAGLGAPSRFNNNAVIGAKLERQLAAFVATGDEGSGETARHLLLNYEGVSPEGLETAWRMQQATGASLRNIVFLRDPLNLCASLIHRKRFVLLDLVMVLRQLIAERRWIERCAAARDPSLHLVFYNPWLQRSDYRERLAAHLGLVSSRANTHISRHGGGSSFGDLDSVSETADVVQLTRRWQRYRDQRLFAALVGHPTLAPAFLRLVSGELRDCLGESDHDGERHDYLSKLAREPRRHWLVDRLAATLEREPALLQRIEGQNARGKKRVLLEAHVKALLLPRR